MRGLLCLQTLLLLGCPGTSQPSGLDRRSARDHGRWSDLISPGSDGPVSRDGSAADRRRVDSTKPKTDQGGLCASGESAFGGHCYRVTGVKYIGYTTGKTLCASQNPPMQITALSTAAENQFVYGLLPPLNQVAWIGLKRTGPGTKDFAWDNGEPVVWWNWAAGEPNNQNGSENCVVMWGPNLSTVSFRSFWNDMPCDYAKVDAVICERVP